MLSLQKTNQKLQRQRKKAGASFEIFSDKGAAYAIAGRCNLNNELNMLVAIFKWYKESE